LYAGPHRLAVKELEISVKTHSPGTQ